MGENSKHPDKDIRKLLSEAEENEWTILKGAAYFKCLCPCGEHKRWVHCTPSGANYRINLRKWFERQPCWKG